MLTDTYVLHLANTSATPDAITVDSDKNEFSIRIPESIRSKGKCFIKVISGNMVLENNLGNRIVAANTRVVVFESNISYLGFSTNGRSSGNAILGSAIIGDAEKVVNLLSTNLPTFTCPQLPDVIRITKKQQGPLNLNLTSANEYTANLLPCDITLELTFDSDITNPTEREMFSRRN